MVSEAVDRIREKGHWQLSVHPARFDTSRVEYAELTDIVNRCVVSFRGWPVPFIDYRIDYLRGSDWIGQDIEPQVVNHIEAWRFFTSGLFTHLRGFSADWRMADERDETPSRFTSFLPVWEVLYYLTEVFELASRLAVTPAGDNEMVIKASLHGLEGRGLVVGQRGRVPFSRAYSTNEPTLTQEVRLTRESLVAEPREHAVSMSREFLTRFGWSVSLEQLADHQRELTDRNP